MFRGGVAALTVVAALGLSACASGSGQPAVSTQAAEELVIYSGRSEELIAPLLEQFEAASGVQAEVRYGDTAELAAQLLEEGDKSPADVFFAQDAGALQVIQDEGMATALPADLLAKVPARFRSADGQWVGTSGRARVIVYNTESVPAEDVPRTVFDLTDRQWQGKVGIAPTNASFQAFVTAMRVTVGEERTRQWLEDMVANDVQTFENNTGVLDAVDTGIVELGLVNHYYWFEKAKEIGAENMKVANAAFEAGDPGNLVNVAGVSILPTGSENRASEEFVTFLLSDEAQEYFAEQTAEYPLVKSVEQQEGLPPLSEINGPDLTLDQLRDLRGTQDLLMQVGLL
ncbi:MAG: iron ABC transporter substrate-binding protein [Micrococcales bacterium]|nr:iron ABC transporter substrate-binding protein [Micrococcales bacterium]